MINKKVILVFLALCFSISIFSNAIFDAIEKKNIKEVKRIIKEDKENVNVTDYHRVSTPLLLASFKGYKGIVKLLIENGADVNKGNKNGDTPLLKASIKGYRGIVKLLIENGADVNKGNNKGDTPLLLASSKGYKGIVKLLLENRADVNKESRNGDTSPLMEASIKGYRRIVKLLLESGADVNKESIDGFTPLLLASFKGYKGIVKLLIESGADLNKTDKEEGFTSLMFACYNRSKGIINLLLENGADVNKEDLYGGTALLFASESGYREMVKLLLENGAKIDVKSVEKSRRKKQISKYIDTVLGYDKLKKEEKIKYILDMKDKDKELFNLLVRVAFGRAIQKNDNNKYTPISNTVFYRLYKQISQNDLGEIFDAVYNKDIFKFIKNILRNRSKNHFYVDKLLIEKRIFKKNLFGKTKGKKPYADLIVHTGAKEEPKDIDLEFGSLSDDQLLKKLNHIMHGRTIFRVKSPEIYQMYNEELKLILEEFKKRDLKIPKKVEKFLLKEEKNKKRIAEIKQKRLKRKEAIEKKKKEIEELEKGKKN